MSAIKYIFFSVILVLMSCGAKSPKDMAREYCSCFKEAGNDPQMLENCVELLKTHKERLGKNLKAEQQYAEEIIRCAVYNQPE
jgi:hypothetical protein